MTIPSVRLPTFTLNGNIYTVHDLPSPHEQRWTGRKKAILVLAVKHGLLTEAELLERYKFDGADFAMWTRDYETHGLKGMQVTTCQARKSYRA